MSAYSLDLRIRVLADWDGGMKAEEVTAKYRVSRAWVHRLVQRRGKPAKSALGSRPRFARGRSLRRRIASSPW